MTPRVSPTRSKSARDMRREGQWGLWLVRILFASMLLLKHKYTPLDKYFWIGNNIFKNHELLQVVFFPIGSG